ncbi:MAG: lipopolysaccharide biosynthesis protein [Sphingomicrobium sp.]
MRLPEAESIRAFIVEQQGLLMSSFNSLLLRIGGLASTFLLGVVLARALGPANYGIYGLVSSLVAVAVNIILLGTQQLAVRELAVRSARLDWAGVRSLARSFLTATSLAWMTITILAVGGALIFRRHDASAPALSLAGVILAGGMSATALTSAELRGLGHLSKGQVMDIVVRPAAALILTGGYLIANLRLTPSSALSIQALVAVIAAAISFGWVSRATRQDAGGPASSEGLQWLKAALPLGVVDVLRVFDGAYGVILVGILGSAIDLGIYRVALASSILVSMPVTILHVVMAPTVSRLHRFGERRALQRLLRVTSAGMCAILIPMLIILLLFGRPLVELVFGPVYVNAATPLAILCGAQLIFGFVGMGPVLLAMAGSERHLSLIYIASVIAGVLAALLLVPTFGAIGAATAQVVSGGSIAVLSARFAHRRLGLGTTFFRWTGGTQRARDCS